MAMLDRCGCLLARKASKINMISYVIRWFSFRLQCLIWIIGNFGWDLIAVLCTDESEMEILFMRFVIAHSRRWDWLTRSVLKRCKSKSLSFSHKWASSGFAVSSAMYSKRFHLNFNAFSNEWCVGNFHFECDTPNEAKPNMKYELAKYRFTLSFQYLSKKKKRRIHLQYALLAPMENGDAIVAANLKVCAWSGNNTNCAD